MDVETWVPISLSPPADFRKQFASFSLITVSRARTNPAHCAVALSRKAMSVIHGHDSSTAIRSASREGRVWRCPSSKIVGGKCHEMLRIQTAPPTLDSSLIEAGGSANGATVQSTAAMPLWLSIVRGNRASNKIQRPTSTGFSDSRICTRGRSWRRPPPERA